MPALGEGADDGDLVLGSDPGKHADALDAFRQLLRRHPVQVRAGDDVPADAEFAGDRHRGFPVIPGDHLDGDAGPLGEGDGVAGLRAWRVSDADEAEQRQPGQLLGQFLTCAGEGATGGVEQGRRRGQHPQPRRRQPGHLGGEQLALGRSERAHPVSGQQPGAAREQHVWGALEIDP